MIPSDLEKMKIDSSIDDEKFFDTSEKILSLSDRLAEDIVLENISEQLTSEMDIFNQRINYVSLFKEKYSEINSDDDEYDEEYLKEALGRVASVIGIGIRDKYGVELGEDLDLVSPAQYLEDMETLYEFLFIRQYDNLVDYLKYVLFKEKKSFVESYSQLMTEETHGKDLFVREAKKKFKNSDDIVIVHFLNEILYDIAGRVNSAFDLFNQIIDLDKFEEYNNRMSELLIDYGNKAVIPNDMEAANKYLAPLKNPQTFGEIRNSILISYLEGIETE